ncbi:MAG TPA: glucose 1-dehydrogenase [Aliidongia sp.]|nr:glucose 1-dehydrogenase [Aliidongia sp.]
MTADLFRLDGKTALVTGASSGFGHHFALVLARAGAAVLLGARRTDRLEALAAEIRTQGGHAHALTLDVTQADSVEAALAAAGSLAGPIDILINNSGVSGPAAFAADLEEQDWDRVMDTNLKGTWLVSRAVARRMIAAGQGGSIVNIASMLGLRVAHAVSAYAVSKAGVTQLTKAMALELARHRIRVNALAPGYFETDLNREYLNSPAGQAMIKRIPQRRTGQVEDLDGVLLLLASDASRYMTGTVIPIDGGHLIGSL